jgi:hypothetical protein
VLGLGDSLYFYVGHACPEFGQIVLVYTPEWSSSEPGGATPFDTGGLRLGYVKGTGTEDPVSYCTSHSESAAILCGSTAVELGQQRPKTRPTDSRC